MYNSDMPTRAELPTSSQLIRSTLIAAGVAAALLITVVLPAEYGIDPTGTGRALGLAEMGEIKKQLAKEAETDRALDPTGAGGAVPASPTAPERRSNLLGVLFAQLVIGSAAAQPAPVAVRSDELSFTLKPSEAAEVKADMKKGAKVAYRWKVEGGTVNHDTHGEPHANPNATHSYSKGRSVANDEGVIEAAFDGNHGWFWRNRGSKDVTVMLTVNGDYGALKRVK